VPLLDSGAGTGSCSFGKGTVMRRTIALTSALVVLILFVLGAPPIPAQIGEAQLLGEWVGKWTGTLYQGTGAPPAAPPRGIQNNGDYRLMITKVEGNKVHGWVQQPGLTVPEFKFVGTLNQNILSYGNERYQTELTIKGDKMTGTRQGGTVPWQISLQRKK
jgi:hypothetical protein